MNATRRILLIAATLLAVHHAMPTLGMAGHEDYGSMSGGHGIVASLTLCAGTLSLAAALVYRHVKTRRLLEDLVWLPTVDLRPHRVARLGLPPPRPRIAVLCVRRC